MSLVDYLPRAIWCRYIHLGLSHQGQRLSARSNAHLARGGGQWDSFQVDFVRSAWRYGISLESGLSLDGCYRAYCSAFTLHFWQSYNQTRWGPIEVRYVKPT
jgi:hypothetical protein